MIKKTLKLRKEKFGWIACNISDCNVYEISEDAANIISLLKKISKKTPEKDLFKIAQEQKEFNKKLTKEKFNDIFKEIKALGWIDDNTI